MIRFLKVKTSWSNAELALLKICLLSIGILLGVYFYDLLKNYISLFWVVGIITTAGALMLWIRKINNG